MPMPKVKIRRTYFASTVCNAIKLTRPLKVNYGGHICVELSVNKAKTGEDNALSKVRESRGKG